MSTTNTNARQEKESKRNDGTEVLPMETDNDVQKFEEEIEREPADEQFVLRLYVTGSTPKSVRAIENIRIICDEKLKGRCQLEVFDLREHPEYARPEQIIATPTLVKKLPLPVRRLVGDLSDHQRVLAGLDVIERKKNFRSKNLKARPDGGNAV